MESYIFISVVILLLIVIYRLFSFNLWLTAFFVGVNLSITELVLMKIKRLPIRDIIFALIATHKSGYPVRIDELKANAEDINKLRTATKAYIKCKTGSIHISFSEISKSVAEENEKFFITR